MSKQLQVSLEMKKELERRAIIQDTQALTAMFPDNMVKSVENTRDTIGDQIQPLVNIVSRIP